ncbi:tyrosine-type recombinase/integrase [Kitasatospora purpeofusca]|uniref:tyrosine-type recombinase/integrase n=1 Tax=Kitasatospora purpeofusca TaxID=67352 RepID=UPI0038705C94|nr:LacI family DNA-binding transcriptional regulator [Kitasatospora purpeofusca]
MGFAENRGDYWRGRYKVAPGQYGTVQDENGKTKRFKTKRAAEKAANIAEEKAAEEAARPPAAPEPERMTFGEYASAWYEDQDLAASTMQNYRRHIEEHLLPEFEDVFLDEITKGTVDAWERRERERDYAPSSIKTWRGTLHLILADAVDAGLRDSNPASRRRGRGKRAGRSRNRSREKVITTGLGILLIAERTALLSGRDDEFVGVVLKGYTGMRWGEIVGLEAEFIRPTAVRVEWQLYELDSGEMHRCPPKDDSYRTIDAPSFLAGLLAAQVVRAGTKPCECHGRRYLFSGHGAANGAARRSGAKLVDVARAAGVSTGTVSNVLNRPHAVALDTRSRVEKAIADLGYIRYWPSGENAAHWRRNGFATWLFHPATTGWYPKKAPEEARPVPLLAEPWPGIPARGRGASGRAEACWLPIQRGLTPHGLRHTHKTMMDGFGTPPKLKDERMGHEDGSVQARYSHITAEMRSQLMDSLTAEWEASLEARRRMSPGSSVGVLDTLLRAGQ